MQKPKEYVAFTKQLASDQLLVEIQHGLYTRLDFLIDNVSALIPALAIDFYVPQYRRRIGDLRICRDDFDKLRQHYIDSFELCHKVLYIVAGYVNIANRGHEGAFLVFPKTKNPNNLKEFRNAVGNYRKPRYIDALPLLMKEWEKTFPGSVKLRNKIGHGSARFDRGKGTVQFEDGGTMPYTQFLYEVLSLTTLIALALQIVKLPLVHWDMITKHNP